ncbi:MAG: acetyl-CoA carboxylase biotin carboxylase subunit [Chloroflexota bacterium]
MDDSLPHRRQLRKILIANRGEIAVRVMQTCREMGIATIAVYSSADRGALHVQMADEAYGIGPAPASESYLDIPAIINAARQSGADAVHPGYGFLAENDRFAQAVLDEGLVWVGPSPAVMALMGDKIASKARAVSAGVPVVPGYSGDDQSEERFLAESRSIQFPVMLKASAGGGGRGMREVASPEQLSDALASAKREAKSAFGSDRIFLEKLIRDPRHIEIQIALDEHGNGVHLGERDCSIQRRHQKVMEETPSPALYPQMRAEMGDAALRLARAAGYTNIGTVEFLFSDDRYYFLEMNTRIQVEHPVTEMVTGMDLVRMQLLIATGEPLGMTQLDVRPTGHAIQARLYAEDPENGFLPSTGRVTTFQPPSGAGIRNDVGVYEGFDVGPYYDSMLAKLVVHSQTREQSVARLRDALERYNLAGLRNNRRFLAWIAGSPEFTSGRVNIRFIESHWPPAPPESVPEPALIAGALYQSMWPAEEALPEQGSVWRQTGGWRASGTGRTVSFRHNDQDLRVEIVRNASGGAWDVTVDGVTRTVEARHTPTGGIRIDDAGVHTQWEIERELTAIRVSGSGNSYLLQSASGPAPGARAAVLDAQSLSVPMPGTVVKVAVAEGQRVLAREPLVVLEAMKMEHVVEAPHDGVVREILYAVGDLVPADSPLVRMEQS